MASDKPTKAEEATTERQNPIDAKWVVANLLGIMYFLEGKFGPGAVEEIVTVSAEIEKSMEEDQAEE